MKRPLVLIPLLLAAGAANADMASYSAAMPRYDIAGMTCDELHEAMQSSGKAILHWQSSSGMPRWGKYVSGPQQCSMQQIPTRARVATSDTKSCMVTVCNNYGRSLAR